MAELTQFPRFNSTDIEGQFAELCLYISQLRDDIEAAIGENAVSVSSGKVADELMLAEIVSAVKGNIRFYVDFETGHLVYSKGVK